MSPSGGGHPPISLIITRRPYYTLTAMDDANCVSSVQFSAGGPDGAAAFCCEVRRSGRAGGRQDECTQGAGAGAERSHVDRTFLCSLRLDSGGFHRGAPPT
ncbi:hypothetical protein B0H10DRAFT_1963729 [Mycena sp. CBHHK59/15]|nr:hypothetical protein B0H10DRAFT_1963729 [Mycena sp. CBHHK59/15]